MPHQQKKNSTQHNSTELARVDVEGGDVHEGEADAIASSPEARMGNDKKYTERLGSDLEKTDGTGEPPKVFNKVEIDGGDSSLSVAFTQKKFPRSRRKEDSGNRSDES